MAVVTIVAGSILGARDFGAQLNEERHGHQQPADKEDRSADTTSVVGGGGTGSNGSNNSNNSNSSSMRRSVSCASRTSGDSPTGSPHSDREENIVRFSDGQEVCVEMLVMQ